MLFGAKKIDFLLCFLMLKKRLDLGNLYFYDKLKSIDLIKIYIYTQIIHESKFVMKNL